MDKHKACYLVPLLLLCLAFLPACGGQQEQENTATAAEAQGQQEQAQSEQQGQAQEAQEQGGQLRQRSQAPAPISCDGFLSKTQLAQALKAAEGSLTQQDVRAVVVPHHAVAASLTVSALKSAGVANVKRVVILAPNHQNLGAAAITSLADFSYQGSSLECDRAAAAALSGASSVSPDFYVCNSDDEVLRGEHAVAMLIPIIAALNPDAQVLPIILHHDYPREKLTSLLNALRPYLDEDTLLVGSVDFAHHLRADEAAAHGKKTASLIEEGDFKAIEGLDSTYLDAPMTLSLIMRFAASEGLKATVSASATAAAFDAFDDGEGSTGYLTVLWQGQ